jgi:hypothetical protein
MSATFLVLILTCELDPHRHMGREPAHTLPIVLKAEAYEVDENGPEHTKEMGHLLPLILTNGAQAANRIEPPIKPINMINTHHREALTKGMRALNAVRAPFGFALGWVPLPQSLILHKPYGSGLVCGPEDGYAERCEWSMTQKQR